MIFPWVELTPCNTRQIAGVPIGEWKRMARASGKRGACGVYMPITYWLTNPRIGEGVIQDRLYIHGNDYVNWRVKKTIGPCTDPNLMTLIHQMMKKYRCAFFIRLADGISKGDAEEGQYALIARFGIKGRRHIAGRPGLFINRTPR